MHSERQDSKNLCQIVNFILFVGFQDESGELRRKWNRICQSLHQSRNSVFCKQGKSLLYSSMYPGWANDQNGTSICDSPVVKSNLGASSVPRFRRQQSCHIEFSFSNGNSKNEPNLDSLRFDGEDKEVKITLALGNSPIPIPEKDLRDELHENLPWQPEISLSFIHEALMGMQNSGKKQEWLLIQGNDVAGKRRLARVIAHSIFASAHLLCLNMRRKGSLHTESLEMALRNHARIVVLVESVDLADPPLLKFLADTLYNGDASCHAIFILTMDDQSSYTDRDDYTIPMKLLINERSTSSETTSNKDLKRRAEWDLQSKSKGRRNNLMEDASSMPPAKDLSLDLNIKAEDDNETDDKAGDSSPISSDLTRDSMNDQHNPLGFLEMIKNQVVLNNDSAQEQQAKDMLSSKIKQSLEQVLGEKNMACLCVDENVTEELLHGCGAFLNSLFEKWLKDVVQTSLQQMVDHRKEGVSNVRLCLGEKGDTFFKDGFMGTCLPKRI